LVLQLDHKNGDGTDNRLENLEFLCPNCHSQTKTYGGKNANRFSRKPSKEQIDKAFAIRESNKNFLNATALIAKNLGKELFLLASKNKTSLGKLSRETGHTVQTIKKCFKHFNIPYTDYRLEVNKTTHLTCDYFYGKFAQGSSFSSMSKEIGCSDVALKKKAKALGVDLFLCRFTHNKN
jgi:hypothetical protein